MPSFSERIGITPIKTELLKNKLSNELRNSLWSALLISVLDNLDNKPVYDLHGRRRPERHTPRAALFNHLWLFFFKYPIDNLPVREGRLAGDSADEYLRKWFFEAEWYEIYNFLESIAGYLGENNDMFILMCNSFLKRELSAYRFVDSKLVEINSEEEIIEIEKAINSADKFKPVKAHLSQALSLISDKQNPDYRNSVKESISAVESLCKIIVGNDSTTLGKALPIIEKQHKLPNSLKAGFSALYGFTSDKGGIRHSLLDGDFEITIDEARFMLIACSSFINYLISKNS